MSMNDIWRFIAFYNGKTTIGGKRYHEFDISTFFTLLNIENITGKYIIFYNVF